MRPRRRSPALVALLALTLAGCGTTIRQVMNDPARYHHREVGLKGDVVRSFSVFGTGAFMLDDGTGRLWVVSRHGVPREGARVKVRGRIRDIVDLGGAVRLPPEVASGLVMEASDYRGH
jgi:hypothetical protein